MGKLQQLQEQRRGYELTLENGRAALSTAEAEHNRERQNGYTKRLAEIEQRIAEIHGRVDRAGKAIQSLDNEISDVERDARILKQRMGEALLPELAWIVAVPEGVERKIAHLLTEYNNLVGEAEQ